MVWRICGQAIHRRFASKRALTVRLYRNPHTTRTTMFLAKSWCPCLTSVLHMKVDLPIGYCVDGSLQLENSLMLDIILGICWYTRTELLWGPYSLGGQLHILYFGELLNYKLLGRILTGSEPSQLSLNQLKSELSQFELIWINPLFDKRRGGKG